jgi:hypothetical protein
MEAIPTSAGFGQNGPLRRQEALKYRHIPVASFLALSHFDSNLVGAVIGS